MMDELHDPTLYPYTTIHIMTVLDTDQEPYDGVLAVCI